MSLATNAPYLRALTYVSNGVRPASKPCQRKRFTVNNRTKTGLSAYCRPCWNTKQRAYHAEWMKAPEFRENRRKKWQTWQQENKELCANIARQYRDTHREAIQERNRTRYRARVHEPRPCDICGTTYAPKRSDSLTCSQPCRNRLNNQRGRDTRARINHSRRAAGKGVFAEDVSLADIAERDRWKCQLCGKRVNRRLKFPDPLSQSLDHVIPLSLGGDHSRANCQLAHLGCNCSKGARIREPLQLALIG